MSTRCNVVVHYGKNHVYLYRHCDGYPAECGATVAEALQKALGTKDCHPSEYSRFDIFLKSLLANQYERETFANGTEMRAARPMYEFTNDLHGDIEYVYEVNFNRDDTRMVRVGARGSNWDDDSWTKAGEWCSVAGLVSQVNSDRLGINNRLKALRRTSPGAYGDTEDYPMLAA